MNTVKKIIAVITDEKLSNLENKSIIKQYRDNPAFLQSKFLESLILKAKELLKQSGYKVHEVGEMVGYTNSTYFNLVFKSYVNLTPGEYRSKYMGG